MIALMCYCLSVFYGVNALHGVWFGPTDDVMILGIGSIAWLALGRTCK
jgi:hypothetical protein